MRFLLTLSLFVSFNSFAEGYYGRFWRGEAKNSYPELKKYCDDSKTDCFKELVNRWLIPATPSYAAEEALMAYTPTFLPVELQNEYHDEVALILYTSEEDYRRLRSDRTNIEGITYGPIHTDIFEMGTRGTIESSRSLVPQAFNFKVTLEGELKEVSYDLLGQRGDLINSTGVFELVERGTLTTKEFLSKTQGYAQKLASSNLVGAYILITENYFMTYTFFAGEVFEIEKDLPSTWTTVLKKITPTQKTPLLYHFIEYGQGANLFFEPGVKPGKVDHYRLHL